MTEDQLSNVIIGGAIEVHKTLGGPGLLESVYEQALAWELRQKGLEIEIQTEVPILYKGHRLATPLRLDMRINRKVIIECKSVVEYNSIYESQLLTYLRLTGHKLGLVINFGKKYVKDGIHRVVNQL